jgi:hypothetical protein
MAGLWVDVEGAHFCPSFHAPRQKKHQEFSKIYRRFPETSSMPSEVSPNIDIGIPNAVFRSFS